MLERKVKVFRRLRTTVTAVLRNLLVRRSALDECGDESWS